MIPCSPVGRVTVDLIRRSWVRFPPRSKDFFFASCSSLFPFTRANAQWVIHGFKWHYNLHFRVNSLFHYLCSQCYAAQHSYVPLLSLRRDSPSIITDRHPNPLFSVCIISPNVGRKIMQTNCVRKTGAVFFGSRKIISGNLTRAKSTRSIIRPKTSCIIKNNAACFSFSNAACFTGIYPLLPYFFTD